MYWAGGAFELPGVLLDFHLALFSSWNSFGLNWNSIVPLAAPADTSPVAELLISASSR